MRVTARDLGVRLGGRTVFAGLTFDWESPDAIAVTGPNGSGKTTLLKVVATLLRPGHGGLVWHDGGRDLRPSEVRNRLGLTSPEIGLYDELTARENLAFFAAARGIGWDRRHADAWLERVGLEGRGDEPVGSFSSGMAQRLKLVFAFQARPVLVLLDEPSTNLDESGREVLYALMNEARREALVVVATNDTREAAWARERLVLVSSSSSSSSPSSGEGRLGAANHEPVSMRRTAVS